MKIRQPERVQEIKDRLQRDLEKKRKSRVNLALIEVLDEVLEDEGDDQPCFFCHTRAPRRPPQFNGSSRHGRPC